MKTETFGALRARVCGGRDGDGSGDGPAVVLLHGYGAPGDDLVPLWRVLRVPRGVRFVFLEAPIALQSAGFLQGARAWWEIDLPGLIAERMAGRGDALAKAVPDGLDTAREAVVVALEAIERTLGVPSAGMVLGGFSQGAMLSCDLALRTARPLAGLVLLSGAMIAEDQWRPLMKSRAGLPVFQSHGSDDPILPFFEAERLSAALKEGGLAVEWRRFRGQHEIPGGVLDALSLWLSKVCA